MSGEASGEPGDPGGPGQVGAALRPRSLDEFIGQTELRANLAIYIQAARQRGEPMDHVLLHGPPGLGKTTLARAIAHDLAAPLKISAGPVLARSADLAAILTTLEPGEVLFIDEIHRMPPAVEEVLYAAMEDFRLDLVIGTGPGAHTVRLELPRFTLIGATTRAGLLTNPLRERFGILQRLEYYPPGELTRIVLRAAGLLRLSITEAGAAEIARRARGTPRVAQRLLRRVRDFAAIHGAESRIGGQLAAQAIDRMEVDPHGLDPLDRRYLDCLARQYQGGPAGLETLAISLSEARDTIEEVVEPYLIRLGLVHRSARGRMLAPAGWRLLQMEPPMDAADDGPLFGESPDPDPDSGHA